MKNSRIILILAVLLMVITIGGVSAEDVSDSTSDLSSDVSSISTSSDASIVDDVTSSNTVTIAENSAVDSDSSQNVSDSLSDEDSEISSVAKDKTVLESNTLGSGTEYIINDSNYKTYFDPEEGTFLEDVPIVSGDILKLGNITGKTLVIDRTLTITSASEDSLIFNSLLLIDAGSDDSVVYNLRMEMDNISYVGTTSGAFLVVVRSVNNLTFKNNTLMNYASSRNYAMGMANVTNSLITNNTIWSMKYDDDGTIVGGGATALQIYASNSNLISYNNLQTKSANIVDFGPGLSPYFSGGNGVIYETFNNTIDHCYANAHGGTSWGFRTFANPSTVLIYNNTYSNNEILNCSIGIYYTGSMPNLAGVSADYVIVNNTINAAINSGNYNFYIMGNNITGTVTVTSGSKVYDNNITVRGTNAITVTSLQSKPTSVEIYDNNISLISNASTANAIYIMNTPINGTSIHDNIINVESSVSANPTAVKAIGRLINFTLTDNVINVNSTAENSVSAGVNLGQTTNLVTSTDVDMNISNNVISAGKYGIILNKTNDTVISNNDIQLSDDDSVGILLATANVNTATAPGTNNITITLNNITAATGISIGDSSSKKGFNDVVIEDNNLNTSNSDYAYAIFDESYSTYFNDDGTVNTDVLNESGNYQLIIGALSNKDIIIDTGSNINITGGVGTNITNGTITIGDGTGDADSIIISGLTFTNTNKDAIVIKDLSKDIAIKENNIKLTAIAPEDNPYFSIYAINANGYITDLDIEDNTISVDGNAPYAYGIQLGSYAADSNPENIIVSRNNIKLNISGMAEGIYLDNSVKATVTDNYLVVNTIGDNYAYGIQIADDAFYTLYASDYDGNISSAHDVLIDGNTVILNSDYMIYGITVIDSGYDSEESSLCSFELKITVSNNNVVANSKRGLMAIAAQAYNITIINNDVVAFGGSAEDIISYDSLGNGSYALGIQYNGLTAEEDYYVVVRDNKLSTNLTEEYLSPSSASEYVSFINNTDLIDFYVDDNSYSTYFNDDGTINTAILDEMGDYQLIIGNITNKDMVIDIGSNINITGADGCLITNGTLTIGDYGGSAGSIIISSLNFENRNKDAIVIRDYSTDIKIVDNNIHLTGASVSGNNYWTVNAIHSDGFVSGLYIENNNIKVDGTAPYSYGIDITSYGADDNPEDIIISGNNILINKTGNGVSEAIYLDNVYDTIVDSNIINIKTTSNGIAYGIQVADSTLYMYMDSSYEGDIISPSNITITNNQLTINSTYMIYGITYLSYGNDGEDYWAFELNTTIANNTIFANSTRGVMAIGALAYNVTIVENNITAYGNLNQVVATQDSLGNNSFAIGLLFNGANADEDYYSILKDNIIITNITKEYLNSEDYEEYVTFDNIFPIDLLINISVENEDLILGDEITYIIKVTNKGPNLANDVVVNFKLSDILSLVSEIEGYDAETGDLLVGNMTVGSSKEFTLVANIISPGTIESTATVKSSENQTIEEDAISTIDDIEILPLVDLGISLVVNNSTVDSITYEITVKNNGNFNATNVIVDAKLSEIEELIASVEGYDAETGIWTVGDLENGEEKSLVLPIKIISAGIVNKVVTVSSNASMDLNEDNNNAYLSIVVDNITEYVPSSINATISLDAKDGKVVAILTDLEGNVLVDKLLAVSVNGSPVLGASTDENGTYSINVGANVTVVVSYTDDIGSTVSASIKLVENNNTVEVEVPIEVPVVANGTIDVTSTDDGISATLTDNDGNPIANATIEAIIDGKASNLTTDANGTVSVPVSGNATVELSYVDPNNGAVVKYATKVVTNTEIETIIEYVNVTANRTDSMIVCSNMTTTAVFVDGDGRVGEYFVVTLKDANGNPLVGKAIKIGFNAVVYDRVTDENGSAKLQINLKNKGVYTFAIGFIGDDNYTGAFEVAKITVNTQKASLTVPAKTYKASAKTKTLTATLKSASGKVISGKKVSFSVNGKTYTATTNSKGVATVKVSLSTKKTYSFTANFAGDNMFAAVTKTGKVTIK